MAIEYHPASRTHTVRGIEIAYPDKVSPGYDYPDWANNPTGDRNGPMRRQEARVLYPAGMAFVSTSLLEDLLEAENSWGAGGAFLINDPRVQWALENAGLIHVAADQP
jgi:hypothetical protein